MAADQDYQPLHAGFLNSVDRVPALEALRVQGQSYSYKALYESAAGLSATLQRYDHEPDLLTAVLGRRSLTTYAGLLAALMRGTGYLALNPKHPGSRVRVVLECSRASSVLVDESGEGLLEELVGENPRVWVLPHRADVSEYQARWPAHTFVGASDLAPADQWVPVQTACDDIAYVLFTSGTSGQPKGVVVEHQNVTHFVDTLFKQYKLTHEDNVSQFPETTFDGSVADIWPAWKAGATLCVPSDMDVLKTHEFIVREELTVFTFVPSLSATLLRLGLLKPNAFERLRIWAFGAESVPLELAQACAQAAPNAVIDNQYGPTEATVAVTIYRWKPNQSSEFKDGTLPMGLPLTGTQYRLLDEDFRDVPEGTPGELWVGGSQVARGYWDDPSRTEAVFRTLPGSDVRFYRTGDRVMYEPELDSLRFLGRVDEQLKVRGHRVEPTEVERVLRELSGAVRVVAVGWPITAPGAADGLVVFIESKELDVDALLTGAAAKLPEYMRPRRIIFEDRFPLTANGKIDLPALTASLSEIDT